MSHIQKGCVNKIANHRVSVRTFLLYLKEIEFRYNNRGKDLFEELVKLLGVDYTG